MHIWDDPTDQPWLTAERTHISILRCALGSIHTHDPTTHVTDDHILHKAGTTTLRTQARWTKLRYLARVVHHAPPMLLDLLDALDDHKDTWTSTLLQDLQWLDQHLDDTQPRSSWTLTQWLDFISDDYNRWIKECARAKLRHHRWDQQQRTIRLWTKQLETQHPNLTTDVPIPTQQHDLPRDQTIQTYVCYACHYTTISRARMLIHLSTRHPRQDAPHRYVTGHVCKICLTDYHTRDRLITHLKGTARCWPAWQQLLSPAPLTHDEQTQQEAEVHNTRIANTKAGFHKKHADLAPIPLTGPRLPRHQVTPQRVNRQYTDLLTSVHLPTDAPIPPTPPSIPTYTIRHPFMYVLALHTGPRRHRDFQTYIDRLSAAADIYVRCLSINDSTTETDPTTINTWRQAIREGKVCALFTSPPTPSWTTLTPNHRTNQHPWGRPGLPTSQQTTVDTDNHHLRTTLTLLYDCYECHVPAILALPTTEAPLPQPHLLPPVQRLRLQAHSTNVWSYLQHDQLAPQPTHILGLHTPDLQQHLNSTSHPQAPSTSQPHPHPAEGGNTLDQLPTLHYGNIAHALHQQYAHWPQLSQLTGPTPREDTLLEQWHSPLDPYITHSTHDAHHDSHDNEPTT